MKKWFGFLLFGCCGLMFSSSIATQDAETGRIRVSTAYYQCTFFPGHMFPVWFKKPDGKPFPRLLYFYDRVWEVNRPNRTFFLYRDLWAEQNIIENSEDAFIIEITGVFCNHGGDVVAPDGLQAKYRYELRRNSPSMKIAITVERKNPGTTPMPFHLFMLQPVWEGQPFNQLIIDGKPRRINDLDVNREVGQPGKEMTFSDGVNRVGIRTDKREARAQIQMSPQHDTALLGNRILNWKTPKVEFSGQIFFEPKTAK